jgi:membrane protease YdiL (CAAX protease family)
MSDPNVSYIPPAWGPSQVAIPYPQDQQPLGTQPTTTPDGRVFPGIGISLAWIVMYFVMQIVATVVMVAIALVTDPKLRDQLTSGTMKAEALQKELTGRPTIVLGGLVLSGMLTIAILAMHLHKYRRHELINVFRPNQWSWGKTIGTAFALQVGTGAVGALYTKYVLNGKETQKDTTEIITSIKSPTAYVLGFVAIAVIAPIVEELLFRGYLQSALSRRMKPWLSILIASVVFGAIHFQPLAFPLLAALGAGFGYLYHRTQSLKVNIALHMINNGLAFFALVSGVKTGT